MISTQLLRRILAALPCVAFALPSGAQTFEIQCPAGTTLHPAAADGTPNPDIKCQQLSGGDGFATMADGTQTYLFSFGPLSGLKNIKDGLPGTLPAADFLQPYQPNPASPSDPDTAGNPNGAVGLEPQPDAPGHVDPRPVMDVGVLNGNMPAPLIAIAEDDELFLTLTNVGQIMRPDLFEQHTVHFHGYPNASSFYDGVPDASVAINIGGSFTYYYLAPDAGTYIWHCHITPPEHLQMGMVGQLYVRPRQDKLTSGDDLGAHLLAANKHAAVDAAATGRSCSDILCTGQTPVPKAADSSGNTGVTGGQLYAYNDGDGSTQYDVEYPIQIHGFDPDFHFVGMTFNPENFTDSKNKYFLLNGRSYPDTVTPGALSTQVADGSDHFSQPLPTIINIPFGGRALLRFGDLETNEFQTLASLGIPMHVIALNARLLRDLAGNNLAYDTNSITMGGGESLDVILDAHDTAKYPAGATYYLYTPNLDHLSNDAENFGGLMTEVHICPGAVDSLKQCVGP
ncbi:MAG TPA: multicopper oxidase domain-containing protein [Steroidobacteraceae bacterium]|nr:multicopper oxidase domain-containing protein [Steroidobacteraceae bacterium]